MKANQETRYMNGVKVEVTPLAGTDCQMKVGGATGGMFNGVVQFRVYTNKDFALVQKAFPNLGWHKAIDRLNMWSDEAGKPEIESDFLV